MTVIFRSPASRFCVAWSRLARPPRERLAIGVHLRGACAKHSASGCMGTQPACRHGSGRAGAVAAEYEHTKYSTRYSGRNCGDQIAQISLKVAGKDSHCDYNRKDNATARHMEQLK